MMTYVAHWSPSVFLLKWYVLSLESHWVTILLGNRRVGPSAQPLLLELLHSGLSLT